MRHTPRGTLYNTRTRMHHLQTTSASIAIHNSWSGLHFKINLLYQEIGIIQKKNHTIDHTHCRKYSLRTLNVSLKKIVKSFS